MLSTVTTTESRQMPQITEEKAHYIWWQLLLQGFAFCAIAVVLVEVYFRLAGVGGSEYLQPDLQMGIRHIPGKLVIWRAEGFSNNRMNGAGLRDNEHTLNKEPGTYRIALLGDSVVEALQVDLNDTFGKILERRLNKANPSEHYETINFGCGSYSTGQEVVQYEREGAKYKPDAIVLVYNRGDSMESVVTSKDRKRTEPRPYFYIDRFGQLKEDDSVLAANFDKLKPNLLRDWLRKNSAIYGVINQADFSLTLNEPLYRKIKGWVVSLVNAASNGRPYKEAQTNHTYPDQDEMLVTKALIHCKQKLVKLVMLDYKLPQP